MLPASTEVAVVGAGPTGLALAATLSQAGIDVLLLDRRAAPRPTSRAAAVHARTLEVLEGIGATRPMVAAGLRLEQFELRDRARVLLRLGFGHLDTRYPYVLALPQNETEAILTARLAAFGGRVHRGWEATGLRQDADCVELTLVGEGSHRLRARYVVGADGYHSQMRAQAGIAMRTGTYAQTFVLGDVRIDRAMPGATLFLAPGGLLAIVALPGGHHRLIATLEGAAEEPDAPVLQNLLDTRGPPEPPRIVELSWASRFRIHHGVAASFRAGRVFLAGDAAHVHSPAGGQGMNIGIQDACRLGALLAEVVQGRADPSSLDAYERERRPIARGVVRRTDRLTRMVTLRGPLARHLRNAAIRTVGHLPWVQHRIAGQLAGLRL